MNRSLLQTGAVQTARSRPPIIESAAPDAPAVGQRAFVAGLWATALGTLASRALGLARDMATAALLGEGMVMDALVIALRVPNLFRRLFGEGALAACYVPALAAERERDRESAWRLTTAVIGGLALGLAGIVLVGELSCALAWFGWADSPRSRLVVGLTATLLPYLWFICVAAQLAATLQTLGRFAAAACGASLLNVCWLVGVLCLAPRLTGDPACQAYVVALCVLASGAAQVGLQGWVLWRAGFRWRLDLAACREPVVRIVRAMGPLVAGLGAAQLSALADSLIAWLLAAPEGAERGVWWLGGLVDYPLEAGTASTIYYAERFYQLPLGLVGVAAATAVFPLLSRHAARNRPSAAAADLGQSLRLAWFAATPIALGIGLLAEPLVRWTLERGRFTSADTSRAAGMIVIYAAGVWAFCALPSLTRACFALGEYRTATRAALAAAGANFLLSLALIWPLAERGLALAATLAASGQALWLLAALKDRYRQPWRNLLGSLTPSIGAAAMLAASVFALDALLPPASGPAAGLARLAALATAGAAAYVFGAWMLGSRELTILVGGLTRRLGGLPAAPRGLVPFRGKRHACPRGAVGMPPDDFDYPPVKN